MYKYIVIESFDKKEFENEVSERYKDGYIAVGGVVVLSGYYNYKAGTFYQSMVLKDSK